MNVSAPSALRIFVCAALPCLLAAPAFGQQPAASDYTTAMPSVDKIKTQLQGTDPIDTAARQAAVLEYLPTYIDRIRGNRSYNAPYTPSEQKLVSDYTLAFNQLKQDFTKSHTADELKRFNQLEGNYSVNNALGWITQLEGQQAADTYSGAESSLMQGYQQHESQLQQQVQQENSPSGGGGLLDGILGGDAGGGPLDANQKRCLELGGTYDQCTNSLMGAVGALGSLLFGGAGDTSNGQLRISPVA
jgi:hypothetical protein